jgi:hypothetical protein
MVSIVHVKMRYQREGLVHLLLRAHLDVGDSASLTKCHGENDEPFRFLRSSVADNFYVTNFADFGKEFPEFTLVDFGM